MRIGLFGGTFDPPHAAHRAPRLLAMKRLGLDRVWWLVTPGNPLKDTQGPRAARNSAWPPRAPSPTIRASTSAASKPARHRYTYEIISYLVARCPGVHFVWIMGADNLRSFHRWQRWRGIASLVPIAVVDRLGPSLYATFSICQPGAGARPHPRNHRRRRWRNESRRPGFCFTASNRRCPRPPCGRRGRSLEVDGLEVEKLNSA